MGILDGSVVQPTPTIRVAKQGGGDEEVDNPAYRTWIVQDQQLLAYLLSTMTKEILVQVSSHEHAASLWKSITEMFSSVSVQDSAATISVSQREEGRLLCR